MELAAELRRALDGVCSAGPPEVRECREYRQTLSKLLNSLIGLVFFLGHALEYGLSKSLLAGL